MKKHRVAAIALMMAAVILIAVLITTVTGVTKKNENQFRIVATFYPMYVAALNVADEVDNTQVVNLTPSQTGCLHDYQLSPDNMVTLKGADVLILNGAGAESFLDNARKQLPNLPVIDTSSGIALLESGHEHEHEHEHEQETEEHEELYNEHIWVSPSRYIKQVENLRDGLIKNDPDHKEKYASNAASYIQKITDVGDKLKQAVNGLPTKSCITFHDSLTYLAEELGLHPIAALNIGEESSVSASDLAQASESAASAETVLLLYDNQYPTEYAYVADQAKWSKILTLDTAVSAKQTKQEKNAWLDAMNANAKALLTASETE